MQPVISMIKESKSDTSSKDQFTFVPKSSLACNELANKSGVLAELLLKNGIPPVWPREPGFESLVRIILEQAVSLESAKAVYKKCETQIGLISPASFLAADEHVMKIAGFSKMKWKTCQRCAEKILLGELNLLPTNVLEEKELAENLLHVPGIGPWTVDIYLLLVLQNDDIWPVADRALAVAVSQAHGIVETLNAKSLLEIGQPLRPFRSWAARIFWHDYLIRRNRADI
jgi:DNA-3-methyladenine glycosylase II